MHERTGSRLYTHLYDVNLHVRVQVQRVVCTSEKLAALKESFRSSHDCRCLVVSITAATTLR